MTSFVMLLGSLIALGIAIVSLCVSIRGFRSVRATEAWLVAHYARRYEIIAGDPHCRLEAEAILRFLNNRGDNTGRAA